MNLISGTTCEWPLLASGGESSIEIWKTDFLQFEVWEIHPILLHFPIALLLCGVAAELWGMRRPRETLTRAGAGLLLTGMLSGWATAAAGLLAFWTVPAHTEEAHTWMWWHLGFAATTMLLFTWLAIVRWRRRAVPSTGGQWFAGLCGAVLLTITGWLGGLIVYHGGAGIDPALLVQEIREGHSHGAEADSEEESKSGGHAKHEHGSSLSEGHAH